MDRVWSILTPRYFKDCLSGMSESMIVTEWQLRQIRQVVSDEREKKDKTTNRRKIKWERSVKKPKSQDSNFELNSKFHGKPV